jgi:hypothetical protein
MSKITIYAMDKDSSALYAKTLAVDESLRESIEAFESCVPFRHYYLDWEVDSELTKLEYHLISEVGLDIEYQSGI